MLCFLSPRVLLLLVVLSVLPPCIARGEAVSLVEAPGTSQAYQVTHKVSVTGALQTPTNDGKAAALKLDVNASFSFHERRLPGAGRDAEAYRSVRRYEQAGAKIQVAEQLSEPRLRDSLRLIVAEGRREGVRMFSPAGPLTADELELLRTPGDSLALLALLPDEEQEPGDSWKPPAWVIQFLTGVEAVEKTQLECTLKAVTDDTAVVEFQGEITGGIVGASANIKLAGHLVFDLKEKYVKHAEVRQTEARTVSPVSPGLEVEATAILDRTRVTEGSRITTAELEGIPLDANPATLLLTFRAPEVAARIYHGRNWYLFYPGPPTTVFRMLDKGALIAQCNMSPIPNAAAGEHVAEEQFQKDVQRVLGKGFGKFIQNETIPTEDGRFIYRLVATGEAELPAGKDEIRILPMMWIYYLIAAPDGRQMVLVFTIEASLLERFGTQDLELASSLEFLPAQPMQPTLAPRKP